MQLDAGRLRPSFAHRFLEVGDDPNFALAANRRGSAGARLARDFHHLLALACRRATEEA